MVLFQKRGRAVVTDTQEFAHLGSLRRFTMLCGGVCGFGSVTSVSTQFTCKLMGVFSVI